MKRSLTLVLFIMAIFSVCVFSSSAVQEFTDKELTFSVPDILKNDADWAAKNNYTYSFFDEQEKIELDVSVYENDGFSYSGMDEETLANYASYLEDNFTDEGYTVTSADAKIHRLANGFEGVEFTVAFTTGEKIVYCWFSTDEMCYDFDFYIYNDAYDKYIYEVLNTVSIVPSDVQSSVVVPTVTENVPPVTEEVTDNIGDFVIGDEHIEEPEVTEEYSNNSIDDNKPTIYTVKDLTIEIPAILAEESYDGSTKMWATDDYGLFVGVYNRFNSDDEIAVNFKDDDFQTLFNNIKADDNSIKELLSTENVKINGFKGIKLVYSAVGFGRELEVSDYFFATKDTVYQVSIIVGLDKYAGYVDSIINTMKIDNKPASNTDYYIYIAAIVIVAVLRILFKSLKNKKAKKNAPQTNNNPNYFDPRTDAYGTQYNNQQTPGQNNGYVENSGYAPDYNYSNNLDTTLTNTSDFSKTEYRNATAGIEKKYSGYEED